MRPPAEPRRSSACGPPRRRCSGARVLHLSVAGAGGGRVPELLQASLPIALDLGLEVEWKVLFGGPELTGVAAALQNGLQGAETALEDGAFEAYLEACSVAVDGHDVVVVHDPAGIGAAAAIAGPVVWRCHLDCSRPDPPAWERAAPLVDGLRRGLDARRVVLAARDRGWRAAARHRPAQPPQPGPRPPARGPGAAPARRGPDQTVRVPADADGPLEGPALRRSRRSPSRARSCPSCSSCLPARSTRRPGPRSRR